MFDCSATELQTIDGALEPKLAWATTRRVETEQLALDATRLLSCTESRLEDYKDKGFFKRCWFTLAGKHGEMMRANVNDLNVMQKYAWRYLKLLNERDLLLAHSVITLKNNLYTLAVDQKDIKEEITRLAEKMANRFEDIENRLANVETATSIHSWLLTIKTRDYDSRYTPHLRLLKVIGDFYQRKPGNWEPNEIRYLYTAISDVGIPPKREISLDNFVKELIDELDQKEKFNAYQKLIAFDDDGGGSPSSFVFENIAVASYNALWQIEEQYKLTSKKVRAPSQDLKITKQVAMKRALVLFFDQQAIDLSVTIPLGDLAVELLHCSSLARGLAAIQQDNVQEGHARRTETPPRTEMSTKTLMILDDESIDRELEEIDIMLRKFKKLNDTLEG